MIHQWVIAAGLLLSMIVPACLRADEDVTIMAVGDSITQGGSSFRCYREFLGPLLSRSEAKTRFVGPNLDRFSAHCGYGGKNTSFLNEIIRDAYSKHPADIILLHSGHNSFSQDKPVPGIVKATEEMIETIHSMNPNVTILLAQVIPSGKLPKYSYIPELNDELGKSAVRMSAKGIHVILVNQAEGFDWMSDTVEDKVHPSESGARKMAERWMEALMPVLDQRQENRNAKIATGQIDATTLHQKVLCGYQGWFRCPGDGTDEGWLHWSRRRNVTADSLTVEMWPDLTEFGEREKYVVPEFTAPDNQPACLFSSADASTVDHHFQWMQQYGIDGVFLQRFLVNLEKPSFDTVLSHVRTAALKSGRTYAICYDLSGTPKERLYDSLVNDWKRLVDDLKITQDDRYLHHNGKPVLFVWGFFDDRFDAATAHRIIDFFQTDTRYAVTLIGGCQWYWRREADAEWARAFRRFDVISPWNIGNYKTVNENKVAATDSWQGDLEEARKSGKELLPVIYPGFGWTNLKGRDAGRQTIPRRGGNFYWEQFVRASDLGMDMAYVAMFDEVDEATAIFKVSNSPPTQAQFQTYDGLPSDWYLRLTAEGSKVLRGERKAEATLPIQPREKDHQ